MAQADRLLRDPPHALILALRGMHQDVGIIARETGTEIPAQMLEFVPDAEWTQLRDYLTRLLDDEAVSNADLKGLFNRYAAGWHLNAKGVRTLFERLRDIASEGRNADE